MKIWMFSFRSFAINNSPAGIIAFKYRCKLVLAKSTRYHQLGSTDLALTTGTKKSLLRAILLELRRQQKLPYQQPRAIQGFPTAITALRNSRRTLSMSRSSDALDKQPVRRAQSASF